jgi:hypothetical protein
MPAEISTVVIAASLDAEVGAGFGALADLGVVEGSSPPAPRRCATTTPPPDGEL